MVTPTADWTFDAKVAARTNGPGMQRAAKEVEAAGSAAVISSYSEAYRSGDGFGSKGLAISFPEDGALFRSDPDYESYIKTNTNHPVEFVQNRKWADFLLNRYLTNA